MDKYFVNKNAQENGDHEVHKEGCLHMPERKNRIELGDFYNCLDAVKTAKEFYSKSDGCYYCSRACHTS